MASIPPGLRSFDWTGWCARCTARLLGPRRSKARPRASRGATPPPPRTTRQIDGAEGERIARRFLERHGLSFAAGNVRYAVGELDLVMCERARDGLSSTLVFVEVRRRGGISHGGALESVTPLKRRRVAAAASRYLASLGLRTAPNCRFDVVTLTGPSTRGLEIEWHRDAFRADG